MDEPVHYWPVGEGPAARRLAVRADPGANPGVFWLCGFKSDMGGTKATALADWARAAGRACVRFDYSGHGQSGGEFAAGTIGHWLEDSLAVFDAFCSGPQVLVGSSMGGWLALLLLRALRRRPASAHAPVAGAVLIAPAVDFTETLMWQRFPPEVQQIITAEGAFERPSAYSDQPYRITRALIEEGRQHLLLGGMIETGCPVRILQGVADPDVPWDHTIELVSHLAQDDVVLTLIKDGDHRLSRPEDIERMIAAVEAFAGDAGPAPGSPAANSAQSPSR
jgi:alpha-beta hydrolase superfamily lysophospholipase